MKGIIIKIEKKDSTDELFHTAVEEAKKAGLVQTGDIVVITAGVPVGVAGNTNMIQVVEVK